MLFRRQTHDRITAGKGRVFRWTVAIDKSAFSQAVQSFPYMSYRQNVTASQ